MTAMPPGSAVPWAPEVLPVSRSDLASWHYVVLEEIVDGMALLRRWPWPVVDPLGRLLWPDGTEHDTVEAAVDVRMLKAQLYLPNRIARDPRCGDTFAVPPRVGARWGRRVRDVRLLLGASPVFDVSADAREAAKIAYQSSLGAIQPAAAVGARVVTDVHRVMRARTENHLPPMRLSPPPREVRA